MIKNVFKSLANSLATALVLLPVLAYCCTRLIFGPGHAFSGWSQAFSLLPGVSGVYLRRAFYRLVLPGCGHDAYLGFGTILSHPSARIGRGVYAGAYCVLGDVTLGDDVLLASHVSIINGSRQHGIERLDIPVRHQPGSWPHITIGTDSWIGARAVVAANVGAHCVIGAGAVVTKDIPDYAIAVGVPARVVGYRTHGPAGDTSRTHAAVAAAPVLDSSSPALVGEGAETRRAPR